MGLKLIKERYIRNRLLVTGQTTQYSSEADDGANQKGTVKRYKILTSGAQSGTTNIDLAHYQGGAGAIAFDNTAKTITDTGNGLAIFKTGDVILTDAPNNRGPFTITTGNVAGTITATGATFVTETPAGAIIVYKREAHSNACVLDLNTGLMWSRTYSANMGLTSNGAMVWTGQPYDIFAYAAAANANSLAGYTDWRIPNIAELFTLYNLENAAHVPDTTAFPDWGAAVLVFSSSTDKTNTDNAFAHRTGDSAIATSYVKTTGRNAILVRGG